VWLILFQGLIPQLWPELNSFLHRVCVCVCVCVSDHLSWQNPFLCPPFQPGSSLAVPLLKRKQASFLNNAHWASAVCQVLCWVPSPLLLPFVLYLNPSPFVPHLKPFPWVYFPHYLPIPCLKTNCDSELKLLSDFIKEGVFWLSERRVKLYHLNLSIFNQKFLCILSKTSLAATHLLCCWQGLHLGPGHWSQVQQSP
jgi:hypothetical protein